jgi:hypothetical protein
VPRAGGPQEGRVGAEKPTDQGSNEFRAREAVLLREPKVKPRYKLFEIAP